LRQHCPALGKQLRVVDGQQQIPLFESVSFYASEKGHPPGQLGGQGDFFIWDDGPAHGHAWRALRLLDDVSVSRGACRIDLRQTDNGERESDQGGSNSASGLVSHRMAHQG
jgi:hypothetical protein